MSYVAWAFECAAIAAIAATAATVSQGRAAAEGFSPMSAFDT